MIDLNTINSVISILFANTPHEKIFQLFACSVIIFIPLVKKVSKFSQIRKEHVDILKAAGVPISILKFFMISFPLKKVPEVSRGEKACTVAFIFIFVFSCLYFTPAVIRIYKTPENAAALVWKETGDFFYISSSEAQDATAFSKSKWKITKADCISKADVTNYENHKPNLEMQKNICQVLNSVEGQEYISKEIDKFEKDKYIIYILVPFIDLVLGWISLGFLLNNYYSNKLKFYILSEQEKASKYTA